jgi:DNA-dependent RNA polymerase auxiliary subunit epsilon
MKWVKNLLDTGRHVQLKSKYVEAVEKQCQRMEFDNGNYDVKYIEAVLDFIEKHEDAHQSTRNEIL